MRMLLAAAALVLAPAAAAHAADAAPTADAATARINLDTPVETIVADPAGKAALDANLPGLTTHQHYEHLKGMSLRMIASMAPDQLTAEMLAKAEASLAAIK